MNEYINRVLLGFDTLAKLKKANRLNPSTARALISAHLNQSNPEKFQLINQVIELSKCSLSPFEMPDEEVSASISLAVSENNLNIGMHPHECHCLIAGQTGVGKTTLLNLIFAQGLQLGNQAWLFVRAKDTRSLLYLNNQILVTSFDGNIKFNPLNPNGIEVYDYCNIFADVFIQSQSLYDGTKNYLIECLSFLYEQFEKLNSVPSLFDLYGYIKSQSHPRYSRASGYQDSAINRLGGMLAGPLGKVFDCSKGHEEFLLDHHCIFEIENLTRQQQIFIVNLLITKLFRHKLSASTEYWSLCGIDDGNLLFDTALERRPDQGMPIIHDLLSTVRKSKINVFCCTQTPHQIGSSIHSNSAVKIMFSLANALDTDFMFRCIGAMTPEQKEYCHILAERQIVIKNSLRFQAPIVGVIPEIQQFSDVSDHDVRMNNEYLLSFLPAVVARYQPREQEFSDSNPTQPAQEEVTPDQKQAQKPAAPDIDDKTKTFLWSVNLYQYQKTLTEICKLAGFAAGSGSRLARQCVKKHLVKMIQIKIGRGSPKYPVLLKPAYVVLGIKEKHFWGKGAGHEHVLYQHLIANQVTATNPDARVTIELHRGGKHIDVGVEKNDQLIAIEVAMTATHEIINIEKDIQNAKADFVITACKDEKVMSGVLSKLESLPVEIQWKTRVCLVREILNTGIYEILSE